MKIDKEKLDKLLSLPDDKLWAEIVRLGGAYGMKIPTAPPPADQMARLRSAVNTDKLRMSDAIKLMNEIKREGRK